MTRPRRPARLAVAAGLMAACAAATAAEVVILKDGFVIQGDVRKEQTSTTDVASGKLVSMAKANGFDIIDEGPKAVIFSTHARQLGEINKDIKLRPEYRAFKNLLTGRKSNHQLPAFGEFKGATEFDPKWRRTLEVGLPNGGFDKIEQQLTYLDPYTTYLLSTTHFWSVGYRTSEMDPARVRKLLTTHPDLVEPDKKIDPAKRLLIAKFMKDAGWTAQCRDELSLLTKEFAAPLPKEAQEGYDALVKELDGADAEQAAKEADLALAAGRYAAARWWLDRFKEKDATPKDVERVAKTLGRLKAAEDLHAAGARLLARLIDEASGVDAAAHLAAGGGAARLALPTPKLPSATQTLVDAAAAVLAELHPDTAGRIEFFVNMAQEAERDRAAGKPAAKKPEELLATAVSGWVKGRSGATPDPALATKAWEARRMILAHQRERDANARNRVVGDYKKGPAPLSIDELAQVIALLPPAEPEDLAARRGKPVPADDRTAPGIYKLSTPADRGDAREYYLRLPSEYHHGRAYPVLVALTHQSIDPQRLVTLLAAEADRHGYIVAAPAWGNPLNPVPYDWKGAEHPIVTDVLRDVVRHFTVDNDRVFLLGFGDGANFAMDMGTSHPDLFAGVVALGPVPKWSGFFTEYWRNAQKLPFFIVTGENAGGSAVALRQLFEKWMPYGFPALMTVYKGRGMEWYAAEPPIYFDWMGRKKRVNGTATMKLYQNAPQFEWQVGRAADNRFYWLGADRVAPANLWENARGNHIIPAAMSGDIEPGNLVKIRARGVREISVWLTRDMIDWARPVRVSLNGSAPVGFKPKVLTPDLEFMLNDYRERGDRRLLFLARLEFPNPN